MKRITLEDTMKEFLIEATDGPSIEFDGRVLAALEGPSYVYTLVLEAWETDSGKYVFVRRYMYPSGLCYSTEAIVKDNPLEAAECFYGEQNRMRDLLRLAGFEEVVTV